MQGTGVWQAREQNPAKKYLLEYLETEIRVLAEIRKYNELSRNMDRVGELYERATRATSSMTATRISGTPRHDGMANAVLEILQYKQYAKQHRLEYGKLSQVLCEHIDHMADMLAARLAVIDRLSDERQKTVLTLRYVCGLPWQSIMDICEKPGSGVDRRERTVYSLHGEALEEIRRWMQNCSSLQ